MVTRLAVGDSDAGGSAGVAREGVDPALAETLVVADRYPNFSICGLPFYHSGEVKDWRTLAHRSAREIEAAGTKSLSTETPPKPAGTSQNE